MRDAFKNMLLQFKYYDLNNHEVQGHFAFSFSKQLRFLWKPTFPSDALLLLHQDTCVVCIAALFRGNSNSSRSGGFRAQYPMMVKAKHHQLEPISRAVYRPSSQHISSSGDTFSCKHSLIQCAKHDNCEPRKTAGKWPVFTTNQPAH